MMKPLDAPFYSRETVVGRVVGLGQRFATVDVRGWQLPLETAFIDWNLLRTPDEVLSLGDRVEAVICAGRTSDPIHDRPRLWPKQNWNGAWLSRLPLLDDPWPELVQKYPDGSVVEVEMLDYVNWYIARARMPEGLVVELRTGDIHPRTKRSTNFARTLHCGERFKVVFRHLYHPGGWVERFIGGSIADCLTESGYVTPRIGNESVTRVEQLFIRRRNGH